MTYIITITNDMQQQFCVSAESVVDALDMAKTLFKEAMVTGTPMEKISHKPLSDYPRTVTPKKIVVNPPEISIREQKQEAKQKFLDNIPD